MKLRKWKYCAPLLFAVLAGKSARAESYTWNLPGNGLWNDSASWLNSLAAPATPVSAADTALIFNASGATSYTATNNFAGSFIVNSLAFNNTGTGLITVSGGTINLAGTTPTITVSAGRAAINSILTGTVAATKAGAGSLSLGGASTFSAGLTVTEGTLIYAANPTTSGTTAFGGFAAGTITNSPVGTGTVTIAPGATFTIDNSNRVMRNVLALTGTTLLPSTVDVPAGFEFTNTGLVNGGGVVDKRGTGIWRLTLGTQVPGTSIATLNIFAGTVQQTDPTNNTSGGGDLGSNAINVFAGGKYIFGSFPAFTGENPDLPATTVLTINTGGIAEFNVIEDYGAFNLRGGTYNTGVLSNMSLANTLESGTINNIAGLAGGAFAGAGAIRKITPETVTINGVQLNNTTGGLSIEEGLLITNGTLGGTGATIFGTATTSGTLRYTGATFSMTRPTTLTGQGGTFEVTNLTTTVTSTGAVTGAGTLNKTGAGTLALTGALNQTGSITIGAGTLRVSAVTSAGSFVIANGANLAIISGAGTATLTMPTLTLGSVGSTVTFELATGTLPTAAPALLNVTTLNGLVPSGGTHTLAITNTLAFTGIFPLIKYNGAAVTSGYSLLLPGRTAGVIQYNTANSTIDANITSLSDSVKWTGAISAAWEVNGAANNWKLATSNTPTNFINTDIIIFDDSTAINTITLNATALPASVAVDTAATYTIQGTGSISGATGITKTGTGTLVLATNNTYSGVTTISAGTVQVGAAGPIGTLGTGNTVVDGTLAFNRTTDSTYSGIITGAGSITKTGAGTITLDGNNPFTGTITIDGGSLRIADNGASGQIFAANIFVNAGGKFEFIGPSGNPNLPATTYITITGGIVEFSEPEDYGGFLLRGGTYNTSDQSLLSTGVTTVLESGSLNFLPGVVGSLGGVFGGGGTIQKTTGGTVLVTDVAFTSTGPIQIDAGILSTNAGITGTGTLSFGTNSPGATTGTLRYRGLAATMPKAITINEGGGVVDVTQALGVYTFSGAITGAGSLNKSGPGALSLTNVGNLYSGGTSVSAGALAANNASGSATGTGNVAINAGGALVGAGFVVPASGGVVNINGGAIKGGNSGANAVGTLTIGDAGNPGVVNIAANSTLGIDLRATGTPFVVGTNLSGASGSGGTDNSRITVLGAGSLNFNSPATLKVVVTGDATAVAGVLAIGQTYSFLVGSAATISAININSAANPAQFDFTGLTGAAAFTSASTFQLVSNSGNLYLQIAPVPEPACLLLLGAAACGVVRRRKRSEAGT